MTTVVLEVGHRSDDPRKIGFNVRLDGSDGSVREENAANVCRLNLLDAIKSGIDENLKPQFEIKAIFTRINPREVKIRVDYGQVPNSGCNQCIIQIGMDLFATVRKMLSGKVYTGYRGRA